MSPTLCTVEKVGVLGGLSLSFLGIYYAKALAANSSRKRTCVRCGYAIPARLRCLLTCTTW